MTPSELSLSHDHMSSCRSCNSDKEIGLTLHYAHCVYKALLCIHIVGEGCSWCIGAEVLHGLQTIECTHNIVIHVYIILTLAAAILVQRVVKN